MMDRVRVFVRTTGRILKRAPIHLLLLSISAGLALGAWSLQASAAKDFVQATQIQQRTVPESDAAPPSPKENLAIIASLERGIEVRRQIDEQLRSIESSVTALSAQQGEASDVTTIALAEMERIAAALGGAGRSARTAVGKLDDLRARLRASSRLARLIAEELEELDRSFGPPVGRP